MAKKPAKQPAKKSVKQTAKKPAKKTVKQSPKKTVKKTEEPEIGQQKEMDKLVTKGKKQGYLTIAQITKGLPDEMMTPDQIDDTLLWFDDHDIEVVEKKRKLSEKKDDDEKISETTEIDFNPCQNQWPTL